MPLRNLIRALIVFSLLTAAAAVVAAQKKSDSIVKSDLKSTSPIIQGGLTALSVVNNSSSPSQQVDIAVNASAMGYETEFTFTVCYDESILSNPVVSQGSDMTDGWYSYDTDEPGCVGIASWKPESVAVPAGIRQVALVRFDISPDAQPGVTPLNFASFPMPEVVYDTEYSSMPATFSDGTLTILGPTAADAAVSGRVTTPFGNPISRAMVTLTNMSGQTQTTVTNQFGTFLFEGVVSGQTYILTVSHPRYMFRRPTAAVNVTDDLAGINFFGNPL